MEGREGYRLRYALGNCICGCGASIAQRELGQRADPLAEDDLREMILFSVGGRYGYPLMDALKERYNGSGGRGDGMVVGLKSTVSVKLEVRLTRQKGPMIVSIPASSDCCMRNGQGRSAYTSAFQCVVVD